MSWWQVNVWPIVQGGATIAVGALIVWGVTRLARLVRRREPASMRLEQPAQYQWQLVLVLVGRRSLLEVSAGIFQATPQGLSELRRVGPQDLFAGMPRLDLGQLPDHGQLQVNWIDRRGRRVSIVKLVPNAEGYDVRPERLPRRGLFARTGF